MTKRWRIDPMTWFSVVFAAAALGPGAWMARAQTPSHEGTRVARKAYPTGNEATSVILLERITPAEVRRADAIDYTLRLRNLTAAPVENVVLTEQLHSAFDLDAAVPPPSRTEGSRLTWHVGDLQPRGESLVRIRGTFSQLGEMAFCSAVTFDTSVCGSIEVVQPELELIKTAPAEVLACDTIPLRLVVKNRGSGVARNVRITDQLPDGWTTTQGQSAIALEAGDLSAGQAREFIVEARSSRTGDFVNRATAQEQGGLTARAESATRVVKPELTITKHGPDVRYLNRPARFDITVTNAGDAAARDATLVDTLAPGLDFVSAGEGGRASGGKVTWSLGTLGPGDSRTVSVTVHPTRIGMLENTAVVEAYCARAETTVRLESRGVPAILLEVIDLADPIEVNAHETYEITVLNQGSAHDTNIVITCTLPPEQAYVSADGPTAARAEGGKVTFAPLASLAPKAKATYRVVVRGVAAGDVRFSVSMTSDQLQTPVAETESTHIY